MIQRLEQQPKDLEVAECFAFLSFFFLFHFSFIITVSPYSDPSMRLESVIFCPPFVLALIWFDLLSSYYGLRGISVLQNFLPA